MSQSKDSARSCVAARVPGHFRGVTTVVAKLFHIVEPDLAFFGQKDAAQATIIRRMVRDLNLPVEIVVCPIVREPDGLAMSSRNAYLSPQERKTALVLNRSLTETKNRFDQGERNAIDADRSGKTNRGAGTRRATGLLRDPRSRHARLHPSAHEPCACCRRRICRENPPDRQHPFEHLGARQEAVMRRTAWKLAKFLMIPGSQRIMKWGVPDLRSRDELISRDQVSQRTLRRLGDPDPRRCQNSTNPVSIVRNEEVGARAG